MTSPAFAEHLRSLWQQNSRELALAFFRDAIHPQLTLSELESVLGCEMIQGELADIKLGEVLRAAAAAPLPEPARPRAARAPAARAESPTRRRARPPVEKMRHTVVCALQEAREGMTTTEVAERLVADIPGADPARAIAVLRHLEAGDQVVGDRSRPRRWRLKNPGRRVPEPIIIRKAAVVEAEAEARLAGEAGGSVAAAPPAVKAPMTAAVNGGARTELLSQSEIQRAAQQLHERFFAAHKRS